MLNGLQNLKLDQTKLQCGNLIVMFYPALQLISFRPLSRGIWLGSLCSFGGLEGGGRRGYRSRRRKKSRSRDRNKWRSRDRSRRGRDKDRSAPLHSLPHLLLLLLLLLLMPPTKWNLLLAPARVPTSCASSITQIRNQQEGF